MSNTTPEPDKEIRDGSNPESHTADQLPREGDTAVAPTVDPADDREIVIDYGSAVDPEYVEPEYVQREHGEPAFVDAAPVDADRPAESDARVASSSEPSVLTQADLREDEIRAAEAGTGAVPAEQTVAQRLAAEREAARAEAERAEAARAEAERAAERAAAARAEADRQDQADRERNDRSDRNSDDNGTRDTATASAPAAVRQPIYVQAPSKPKPKSNRGFGIAVSLLATAVFAALYAGILALILVVNNGSVDVLGDVLAKAPYWIPVIFFFLAMALLVAVVNRGGWWAYVLGGFAVAAIVYASFLGGVLVDQANNITPNQVSETVRQALLSPAAIISFLVAREVPIWFGAWIASRGRKVRERNAEAQAEYERILEQGPVVS
ncbi:MFS transporter [Mycetocola zhujimingii]|uniref:MFS transporter n=1 Tax=Mycetocola zhujimingii TaxID=2079792 RepID=A0A2U1TB25_9MICO|nr:MFS transporter [Mycetocola zhujimingii]AWB87220.1 hypothetical protein C3E77_11730 [Mycetocola zhujimingii]PWC06097.1 MFS transporter [Mycetocola zhujimingii]